MKSTPDPMLSTVSNRCLREYLADTRASSRSLVVSSTESRKRSCTSTRIHPGSTRTSELTQSSSDIGLRRTSNGRPCSTSSVPRRAETSRSTTASISTT